MKAKRYLMAAALLAGLATQPALAGDQDFELTNKTGDPLEELYVSPASSDDWEEDVLGQDVLGDGESTVIRFSRNTTACKWDIKVRYPDGDEPIWYNINLCEVSSVTLHWDEDGQKSYATVR